MVTDHAHCGMRPCGLPPTMCCHQADVGDVPNEIVERLASLLVVRGRYFVQIDERPPEGSGYQRTNRRLACGGRADEHQ